MNKQLASVFNDEKNFLLCLYCLEIYLCCPDTNTKPTDLWIEECLDGKVEKFILREKDEFVLIAFTSKWHLADL